MHLSTTSVLWYVTAIVGSVHHFHRFWTRGGSTDADGMGVSGAANVMRAAARNGVKESSGPVYEPPGVASSRLLLLFLGSLRRSSLPVSPLESIPEDWTKSTIVLLHKKGDKGDIGNYRPIVLMSNIYKVFSKILLFRLSNTLEENQPKEQAGFRSNFSTIDHIHVLRQVLQKYREYNKVYYLGFVDFHKAFDSLEHLHIWESLERQGVHTKYIRLLKIIYEKSIARIKLERTGEEFSIERGVLQGDPISPKLFSAVLEMIFRRLSWERFGLNVNGENLSHSRFAVDLVLFSKCPKALEKMLQQLLDESANAGLLVNGKKTKIMSNSQSEEPIQINNVQLEYVNEYIYLGKLISSTENMQKEIERRIANIWKRFWSLSEILKNKDMYMSVKRKVYNACILPCLKRLSSGKYKRGSNRSKGRQTKRWEDDLKKVAGQLWLRTAKQRNEWKALEEAFIERQAVKRGEKTKCRE
ncbi:Retrovirus-related Pol polyprotein from type-2 retrotransposable element R2DM; Endonuclease [Eumeta japonica]|uniref:Retrovirus-related Pol polyprotein from type-2 retrotransposable element R2DM Endonuclease n=1 Tax=Eumeta variegata TaxID=151549 RepID=A0A4C1TXT5_EUMVA|nr:Retrovirus-related Pol polyprotein from type-2 retrotransposable element R2DM; Endonuclease [Eumeta japonica]